MSGKPIPEEAVAQVCDRMLTAAIGKDWRKRAPEAVTAFWMGEVREALQEVVPALTAAQQQEQAVAWFPTNAQGEIIRNYGDGSPVYACRTKEEAEQAKRCHLGATGPIIPLYAAPAQQPAAVGEVMEFVRDIAGQKPEKPDYWSSCGQCESNIGRAQEVLEAFTAAAQQPPAADEAMVERIAALLHEEATGEPWAVAGVAHPGPDRDYYRGLARKVAALAAQRQETGA